MMVKAIIDTKSTSNYLRETLTTLDSHMTLINSDIQKFHSHVKTTRANIRTRGESSPDLMIHLFKAYFVVTYRSFMQYMCIHKDRYDDNEHYTEDSLMTLASNNFENIKREGVWNSPTPEQEQIVALKASITKVQDDNLRLTKAITNPSSPKRALKSDSYKGGNSKDKYQSKYKKAKHSTNRKIG